MIRLLRLFIFGLFFLSACTAVPPLSEADEVAIYTAVIEQIYTRDDTFGGTFNAPEIYILTQTDDSVGDPALERYESRTLSPTVQTDITLGLAHLPTRVNWVADQTAVPFDPTTEAVADDGAILTLGNIHPQSNGTVLVSGSIYIAPLLAGGQTYILEEVNGVWQINGTTGAQWISQSTIPSHK